MIQIKSKSSIIVLIAVGAASVIFTTPTSAHDGGSLYRYFKLLSITPFEKHCVSTSQPGSELQSCLESQPKSELYKIERKRTRARLITLDEIAYDISVDGDAKSPWETFCDNTTSEASLCLYYCYDGIPCPYD